MGTTNLLTLIVLLAVALASYLTGWQAGNQSGFVRGKEAGSKENTDKAIAVGYDRGKREQGQDAKKHPSGSNQSVWWAWAALTAVLLVGLEFLVSTGHFFR
ncbi:MAG: hypothetical protein O3C60_15435 [Planctomycetota bacterium]|nr:hypothetical protein [Planctomycetota bacterium]